MHQDSGVVFAGKGRLLHIAALDHLQNLTAEGFGKGPVPVIVSRYRHNGAGAVGGQDIVGDENGNLLAVYRVHPCTPQSRTPVFSLFSSVRSRSDLAAAAA